MHIIPAIDLKEGKCVRLLHGEQDKVTIFSDDPVEMAIKWEEYGAPLIHVVDLDGAFTGKPQNMDIIEQILEEVVIPVEVGGGIRDLSTIGEYIDLGADRVILGTVAYNDPLLVKEACSRFNGRVVVGIDARDGLVAIKGWTETTPKRAVDLAKELQDIGVTAIIYTDIRKDGTLEGPNVLSIKNMLQSVTIPIIASGGISCLDDLKALIKLEEFGLMGVIVGRALYTGHIDFKEALGLTKDAD